MVTWSHVAYVALHCSDVAHMLLGLCGCCALLAGTGVATQIAAAEAGADIVDCAIDSMSGLTSQPSMGAIVNALAGTSLDTGINPRHMLLLSNYWCVYLCHWQCSSYLHLLQFLLLCVGVRWHKVSSLRCCGDEYVNHI